MWKEIRSYYKISESLLELSKKKQLLRLFANEISQIPKIEAL